MPLLDYLSGGEDDQRSEIEEFLSNRWSDVMDEEPVSKVQKTGESCGWFMQGFSVLSHKVEGQDRIEVALSFKATGYDENQKQTDECIERTATAGIDEYDNVEFSGVEVALTTPDR
jgi:hypothetical protein